MVYVVKVRSCGILLTNFVVLVPRTFEITKSRVDWAQDAPVSWQIEQKRIEKIPLHKNLFVVCVCSICKV